jgi:hypothetical protein
VWWHKCSCLKNVWIWNLQQMGFQSSTTMCAPVATRMCMWCGPCYSTHTFLQIHQRDDIIASPEVLVKKEIGVQAVYKKL